MANILFANAISLFDYTSGAPKSMRLMLQMLSDSGNNIYAVTGCTAYSLLGHKSSIKIWDKASSRKLLRNQFIKRFNDKGIHYSLIKTRSWQRRLLVADESEHIFQEAVNIINKYNINLLIGWGNLLLEEAIFRIAKENNVKLAFYLVNPGYKNKRFYLFDHADLVITDSQATRSLYSNEIKCKSFVIPKALNSDFKYEKINLDNQKFKKNCLFVNPSLNKGLEASLYLSRYLEKHDPEVKLIFVDAMGRLNEELKYLGFNISKLPKNIIVTSGYEKTNDLFKDIKISLILSIWHESGSRLILESYSRGIPVIAFNSGGCSELMKGYKNDIFPLPVLKLDQNKRLRVKTWDPSKMAKRISLLLEDQIQYQMISKTIYSKNSSNKQNMRCKEALNDLIKSLDE